MALKIRLARAGAKKRPYYHIVIADAKSPRDGRIVERIGAYNPMLPKDREDRVTLQTERAQHWLSMGARPTDRVERFLDAAGLLKRATRNNPNKAKPGAKALERAQERLDAEEAKRQAAAEAEGVSDAGETPGDAAGEETSA